MAFLRRRTGATEDAKLDALADLLGDLPLALEEAAAYLEETEDDLGEYLELVRDRVRELFGLDNPARRPRQPDAGPTGSAAGGDRLVGVAGPGARPRPGRGGAAVPGAFLAPAVPRGLPTEQPQVLPADLAGWSVTRWPTTAPWPPSAATRWPRSPPTPSGCTGWSRR